MRQALERLILFLEVNNSQEGASKINPLNVKYTSENDVH
jgi:hypothetical protein